MALRPLDLCPSRFPLVLVGDILTGRGVAPTLAGRQTTLARYEGIIAGADLALGNLEAAPRTARTGWKPFYSPSDVAVLGAAGFDGLNLANNHALDAGEMGARATLRELAGAGLRGAGLSLDGGSPVALWQVGGRRVALVSATEWGPFSDGRAQLTRLELAPLARQIRELTGQGVFVVASLHWGTEGVATITDAQRAFARALIDAGAVAVWGHHPHVAGSVENYRGRPIFASTGNFLWDTMPTPQSGLLVRLLIDGDTPQSAHPSWRVWRIDPEARRLVAPPTPKGETRVGAWAGRFDANNSRVSWIVWTKNAAGRPILRALERGGDGWRVRATGFPRAVSGIEIGDLNGDGRDEIVVELRQRSKLDPQIKARLHVYDLDTGGFKPLWRGSQLSRPFFGWTLATRADDISSDIAALEVGQNGTRWLCVYRWNGFGLRAVWQQQFDGELRDLRSGMDARGPFLSWTQVTVKGARPLRARRAIGENWRVASNESQLPDQSARRPK